MLYGTSAATKWPLHLPRCTNKNICDRNPDFRPHSKRHGVWIVPEVILPQSTGRSLVSDSPSFYPILGLYVPPPLPRLLGNFRMFTDIWLYFFVVELDRSTLHRFLTRPRPTEWSVSLQWERWKDVSLWLMVNCSTSNKHVFYGMLTKLKL